MKVESRVECNEMLGGVQYGVGWCTIGRKIRSKR